ncbi:hypothetical protein SAMN05444416_109120 [Thermoactinomyces sp. DSM 45892]|nr:hypothetical protein SAMN05444416_109120 [Thermoactinomyces sp. DSM 45892]
MNLKIKSLILFSWILGGSVYLTSIAAELLATKSVNWINGLYCMIISLSILVALDILLRGDESAF